MEQPQDGAAAVVHRADRLGDGRAELGHRFQRRVGDQHELGRAEERPHAGRAHQVGERHLLARRGRQARQAEAPRQDGRLGDGFGLGLRRCDREAAPARPARPACARARPGCRPGCRCGCDAPAGRDSPARSTPAEAMDLARRGSTRPRQRSMKPLASLSSSSSTTATSRWARSKSTVSSRARWRVGQRHATQGQDRGSGFHLTPPDRTRR